MQKLRISPTIARRNIVNMANPETLWDILGPDRTFRLMKRGTLESVVKWVGTLKPHQYNALVSGE